VLLLDVRILIYSLFTSSVPPIWRRYNIVSSVTSLHLMYSGRFPLGNSISAGALSQTPLGSLPRSPRPWLV